MGHHTPSITRITKLRVGFATLLAMATMTVITITNPGLPGSTLGLLWLVTLTSGVSLGLAWSGAGRVARAKGAQRREI